ncbi:hypothetical protein ACLOJK_007903 [Asimina triloba]
MNLRDGGSIRQTPQLKYSKIGESQADMKMEADEKQERKQKDIQADAAAKVFGNVVVVGVVVVGVVVFHEAELEVFISSRCFLLFHGRTRGRKRGEEGDR